MGLVRHVEAVNGLIGAFRFFKRRISVIFNVSSVDIDILYMLVIELGVYLFCKYYKCGKEVNDGYKIFADTVYEIYEDYDTDLANIAYEIISTRNLAVHNPYTDHADLKVRQLIMDERLIRLLRCESIIDRNHNLIEPDSGSYKSVLSHEEALSGIEFMIGKINAEDEEERRKAEANKKPNFLSAISKMGGYN